MRENCPVYQRPPFPYLPKFAFRTPLGRFPPKLNCPNSLEKPGAGLCIPTFGRKQHRVLLTQSFLYPKLPFFRGENPRAGSDNSPALSLRAFCEKGLKKNCKKLLQLSLWAFNYLQEEFTPLKGHRAPTCSKEWLNRNHGRLVPGPENTRAGHHRHVPLMPGKTKGKNQAMGQSKRFTCLGKKNLYRY